MFKPVRWLSNNRWYPEGGAVLSNIESLLLLTVDFIYLRHFASIVGVGRAA